MLGSTNLISNAHSSIQVNSPSYMQHQQLYNKQYAQSQQNQQEFQLQTGNFNKSQSSYNNSKRQIGRSQQPYSSSQRIGDGDDREIRQKGKSLSHSISSKSQMFKQYQKYFKSEKYKKLQRYFLEKIHQNLYDKFSQSQNYYYTRDLNDLLQGSRTKFTIKFRDFQVYDEKEEYLKRMYFTNEYPQKIKLLTEYYKFHQDIPRLFMNPLCNIINHMHDKKRRIEFYRIAKIIEDENQKNPNKPQKGIVGDIPAAATEESMQDNKNKNGKQKYEKGLSNFLKDLSSLTNIGNESSKLNINNLTKSSVIKNNIAKHSSVTTKIASEIGKTLQKQQIASLTSQQVNGSNNVGKQQPKQQQQKDSAAQESQKINSYSISNSMQQSSKVNQDTLLDINYKLNDILQQSSMSIKSEVTINDMIDNHGLDDFLKFLSKDQNINLLNQSTRNSLKQKDKINQIGIQSINLQPNNIIVCQNYEKGGKQNILMNLKNGEITNIQNDHNKSNSKEISRTVQSQTSKEEIRLDQIIELRSFQIQEQKHQIQGINNKASDQNSFSDNKKQHISENNSNSTKTSQQNLDKIYSNSKNQQIIQQKINEQIQQQQSRDELSQNQIKTQKISEQTSYQHASATSTAINSTKNSNNNQFDFKLNLKNIQNTNHQNINANQNRQKNNFQQGKRLSTGGATHNESQKILLSHRTNKIDNQLADYPQTSRISLSSGENGGNGEQYSQDFIIQQKSGIVMKEQINPQQRNTNTNLSQQPISTSKIAQINFSSQQQLLSDSLTTKSGYGAPLSAENKEQQTHKFFQKTFNSNLNSNLNSNNNQNINVQNSVQQQQIQNNEQLNFNSITQSQFKISKARKSQNNPSTIPSQKALEGTSPRGGDSQEDPESCIFLNSSQQNKITNNQQQRVSKGKNQSLSSRNQFSSMHGKTMSQINTPSNSARTINPTFNFNINNSGGIQDSNKVIPGASSTASFSQNTNNFQNLINQNSKAQFESNDQLHAKLNFIDQQKVINQIQHIDNLQKQFQIPQQTKGNQNPNQLQQQQQQIQAKFLASQNTQKIKPSFSIKINDGQTPQNNLLGQSSGQLSNKLSQQQTLPFTQKSTTSRDSPGQGIQTLSNQNLNNKQSTPGSLTQRLPIQQTHFRQNSNPIQNNLFGNPSSLLNSQGTISSSGNQNMTNLTNQQPNNMINGQFKLQNTNVENINNNQQYHVQNQEYFQRNSSIINHPSIQTQQYKEGQIVSPRIENQKQFFGTQQILSVNIQQQQIKKQQHKYTKSDQQQSNYNYQQQFQVQSSVAASPSNQQAKMIKNIMSPNQKSPNSLHLQSPNQLSGNSSQTNFNFENIDQATLSSKFAGNNGYNQSSKLQTARQSVQKLPSPNNPIQIQQNNNVIVQNSQTIKMKSVSPRKQLTIPIKIDDKKSIFQ